MVIQGKARRSHRVKQHRLRDAVSRVLCGLLEARLEEVVVGMGSMDKAGKLDCEQVQGDLLISYGAKRIS